MLTPNQEAWLKALESDEFTQTQGALQNSKGYCCLGVGCVLAGRAGVALFANKPHLDQGFLLGGNLTNHESVQEWLGLLDPCGVPKDNSEQNRLTYMNDAGVSFKEIAAKIRANPEAYFAAPEPDHRCPT